MSGVHDFVTAQHAAELALLRMSALSVVSRASEDDADVQGLTLRVVLDGFGSPSVDVEFTTISGMPVGGMSL